MSEQYPSTMQPKSMVTKSPAAIAFSVGTPCGLELFAPDTTIGSNDMFSAP